MQNNEKPPAEAGLLFMYVRANWPNSTPKKANKRATEMEKAYWKTEGKGLLWSQLESLLVVYEKPIPA